MIRRDLPETVSPWLPGTPDCSLCRAAPAAQGSVASRGRGWPGQHRHIPMGKGCLGEGTSLEKHRGATLRFQGGINDKEKPLSACTSSGQAGLLLVR